jgi:hypothetical protein
VNLEFNHPASVADPILEVEQIEIMKLPDSNSSASSLREAFPFWFAISSPLIGIIVGFLAAW